MGIKGLLLNTKSVGKERNISDYQGKTVGIDGYSWLHKALHSASKDLAAHRNYLQKFVHYFERNIRHFHSLRIKVVIVFDGDKLPIKLKTENERYLLRKQNYDLAMENYKNGNRTLANFQYFQSIDVSPAMAFYVKKRLEEIFTTGLEFIVAPFEADSQLAYLSRTGYIDVVITEDSDLLAFQAKTIFYKMNRNFDGVEYKLSEFMNECQELDFSKWDHDKFIQFCILCGCDYLENPKGIGIKRAHGLVTQLGNIKKIYPKIADKVGEGYIQRFLCAFLSFKYPLVYSPQFRRVVHLTDMNMQMMPDFDRDALSVAQKLHVNLSFLGRVESDAVGFQVANMMIDPITKESFISGYESLYNTKKRPRRKSVATKTKKLTGLSRSWSDIAPEDYDFDSGSLNGSRRSPFHDLLNEFDDNENEKEGKQTKKRLLTQNIIDDTLNLSFGVPENNDAIETKKRLPTKQTKNEPKQVFIERALIESDFTDICEALHELRIQPVTRLSPRTLQFDINQQIKKETVNNKNNQAMTQEQFIAQCMAQIAKNQSNKPPAEGNEQNNAESSKQRLNQYKINYEELRVNPDAPISQTPDNENPQNNEQDPKSLSTVVKQMVGKFHHFLNNAF